MLLGFLTITVILLDFALKVWHNSKDLVELADLYGVS